MLLHHCNLKSENFHTDKLKGPDNNGIEIGMFILIFFVNEPNIMTSKARLGCLLSSNLNDDLDTLQGILYRIRHAHN